MAYAAVTFALILRGFTDSWSLPLWPIFLRFVVEREAVRQASLSHGCPAVLQTACPFVACTTPACPLWCEVAVALSCYKDALARIVVVVSVLRASRPWSPFLPRLLVLPVLAGTFSFVDSVGRYTDVLLYGVTRARCPSPTFTAPFPEVDVAVV